MIKDFVLALREFKKVMKNPKVLEMPLENKVEDVNKRILTNEKSKECVTLGTFG